MSRIYFRTFAALAAVLCISASAGAQTFTQPASGTTGTWNTPALWNPAVPVSGTTTALTFNTFAGNTNAFNFTNDIGAFTANSYSLNNFGSGLLTLTSATTLTMGGTAPTINFSSGGNVTIAGTVAISGGTSITGNGNGALQFANPISGTGGLTVNNSGNAIIFLNGATASGFTGGFTLNNGYVQLGASANALGNASNVVTVNGGAFRFATAGTYAYNFTLNSNMVVAGGSGAVTGNVNASFSGILSGSGGITVQTVNPSATSTAGTGPNLTNNNTFTGAVVLNSFLPYGSGSSTANTASGPALTIGANIGRINAASSIFVGNRTIFNLGATAFANSDRIGDTAKLTLSGGRLNYIPGVAATNETIGDFEIQGHAHITGTAVGLNTITANNFIQNGRATAYLDSTAIGTITSATTANKIIFTGTTPLVLAAGSGTGTETGVVPFMVSSSASNPQSFVTYNATDGLAAFLNTDTTRVLQIAPGAVTDTTVLNKNVRFNGNGNFTLTGTNTINSLTTTTSTVVVTGGTLNVFSGCIVNFDGLQFNNTVLNFPNTGYMFNSWNFLVSGTTTITGSNGVVVSGTHGTARAMVWNNTVANTFSGGLTINGLTYLTYTSDNQLGAIGGGITLAGGSLSWNLAADTSMNRDITLESMGGGYSFNVINGLFSTAAATATTRVTLGGTISGSGAFVKAGVGLVNLTGSNSYQGGTQITAGTLQFTTDGNLGQAGSRIVLNGGTLQALATVTTSAREIQVNASSALNAGAGIVVTYPGSLNNVGNIYGTALPTLTISGAGKVVLSGASPLMSGNVAVSAGSTLSLAGGGTLPKISTITIPATGRLDIDDTTYTANRLGNQTGLTLNGGLVNYTAGATATSDPAQQAGILTVSGAGSVFNIDSALATSTSIIRFNSLNITSGNITFRGTNLGDASGSVGHIFFDAFTTNQPLLTNVFFANTSGTGVSTTPAAYDTVRGVIAFQPVLQSGTVINNFNPDNTSIIAAYTTTGDAIAITGVKIYSLTLDGGTTLALNGGNASTAGANPTGNDSTPDGTFAISSGIINNITAPKTITSASPRTIAFSNVAANLTIDQNLTSDANVSFTGSAGLTKAGTATLTINGTYGVTGPLTVSAGTIAFAAATTVGDLSGTGTVSSSSPLTVNSTNATAFTGTLDLNSTATLTKSGTAVFTLSPTNTPTYTGGTIIANGTLKLGNANAAAAVLSNVVTFGSASNTSGTIDLNGFSPPAALTTVNLVGTGTGHLVMNTNLTTQSTVDLNLPVSVSVPMAFSGNLIVNKNDANVLTLVGTNVGTPAIPGGNFKVNAGTLQLNAGSQGIGLGMSVSVANGATFRLNGASTNNSSNFWVNVSVANGGTFISNGTSYFDTYIGSYTLEGGSTVSSIAPGIGAFFHLISYTYLGNTFNPSITTTAGSTTINFSSTNTSDQIQNDASVPLVIDVAQGTTPSGIDVNFAIKFNSGTTTTVTKTGPGTMALSGNASASSYAFVVNAGRLMANTTSTGTGAITVNNTGTLAGNGTVGSTIVLNTGGKITGGNGTIGTLAIASITFNPGSVIGGTITDGTVPSSGIPGSSTVGTLPGPSSNTFLNKTGGTAIGLSDVNVNFDISGTTFTLGSPYSYTIGQGFGDQSALNITDPARFQWGFFPGLVTSPSLTGDAAGFLYLNFTPAVPEPSLLIGLGLLTGFVIRRRMSHA